MLDPFGVILVAIRDDPAVAAIVGDRVSAELEPAPCVRLRDQGSTREPFGPGSTHAGLQLWSGIAQCYGDRSPTGAINARRLAGAVSDALHGKRHFGGSSLVIVAYASLISEAQRDPDTDHPYYTVRIEAYSSAQAVE